MWGKITAVVPCPQMGDETVQTQVTTLRERVIALERRLLVL
jgi:hypothetical protein